jgi:hypothetical protein
MIALKVPYRPRAIRARTSPNPAATAIMTGR